MARLELVDGWTGVWCPLFFCAETCVFQGRKRQFMSPDVIAWWSLKGKRKGKIFVLHMQMRYQHYTYNFGWKRFPDQKYIWASHIYRSTDPRIRPFVKAVLGDLHDVNLVDLDLAPTGVIYLCFFQSYALPSQNTVASVVLLQERENQAPDSHLSSQKIRSLQYLWFWNVVSPIP